MIEYYKQVAVRDGDDQPWRWFREPIHFRLTATMTENGPSIQDDDEAMTLLEDQLAEAVFYHPTGHIRVFQAARLSDFDMLDPDAIM